MAGRLRERMQTGTREDKDQTSTGDHLLLIVDSVDGDRLEYSLWWKPTSRCVLAGHAGTAGVLRSWGWSSTGTAGSVCGSLRTTKSRLTPTRECENNVGGRFTKRPCRNSQRRFYLSPLFSLISASLARPATPARKSPSRTGATPCFECPVRAWAGVGFHKPTPPFPGIAPVLESIP